VFRPLKLADNSAVSATLGTENALVGDYLGYLDHPGHRRRHGRGRALLVGALTVLTCLTLAGATAKPVDDSPAYRIEGMSEVPSPPTGPSWAPAPVTADGLTMAATAGRTDFALHTTSGDKIFLPGVNLGSTTPGHQPGELSVTRDDYRSWFAAMSWLGIRVLRIYTIHPPAFYDELAAHNIGHPDRPLYLMQGVYLPDESYVEKGDLFDPAVTTAFQEELRDASAAVSGNLARTPVRGRAGGTWGTDVTPWLVAWIIGLEFDLYATHTSDQRNADAPAVAGTYFRSTPEASPTERWLAARMDELAGFEAARGVSTPLAFVNWPTTDPLTHPDEPLDQEDLVDLDANHVRPTAAWPAGTFASYHAYPYYPDFQRHEKALQNFGYAGRADPYAGYLTSLKRHHADMPTMITEFGVPSSVGSAHNGPLGRSQGDHSERGAMQVDAELLRLIRDVGLAGGLLFAWTDEWFKFTWNTREHQDGERRQLWHDPLTNEQHFGLVAMDAAGQPDAPVQTLLDQPEGRPATMVTATVDESYLHLRVTVGDSAPSTLTLGFDVLPEMTGAPAPGSGDRRADAAFVLDLAARKGQAYLRTELDPMPLDYPVPAADRAPAPAGWAAFQLVVNRALTVPTTGEKLPAELLDTGVLRHGPWQPGAKDSDSRALWHRAGDDLVVRVPWAMLGFADPSAHRVAVPSGGGQGRVAELTTQVSPGVAVTVSATGTDQATATVTWPSWQRAYFDERLKDGADLFRDALADVTP
jgi:hypothetical protein